MLAALVAQCGHPLPAGAQSTYVPIPNYNPGNAMTGMTPGQSSIQDVNNHLNGTTGIEPKLDAYVFANLPSEADGKQVYCSNCSQAATCAATGTGALAVGINGAWNCNGGGSGSGSGVTSVTASSPVHSSGGSTPNITIDAAPAISGANFTSSTIPKTALAFSTQPYEIHLGITGTPTASQAYPDTCAQSVNFPANFTTPTSVVSCGSNPAETDDYIVKVAGTQIGDISISTSCVATLNTVSHTTQGCTAAQRIELDAPATVSGSNISIVIVGTRAL